MRRFQRASASSTAGISLSSPCPVSAESGTRARPSSCGSSRAASWSRASAACAVVDEVPFVDGDDQGAALLGRPGRRSAGPASRRARGVDHQHHHLGEADGAQRVGDRQLLELLLRPWPGGACRRCRQSLDRAPRHSQSTAIAVAGDAGLGAGQQPLLADQRVDQRRLAGVGAADDGEPQRPCRAAPPRPRPPPSAGSALRSSRDHRSANGASAS